MSTHRLLLAAILAMLAIVPLASSATASRSIGATGGAITATAPITIASEIGTTITSLVTLRGSLNRAIAKTIGSAVGSITECRFTLGLEPAIGVTLDVRCALTLPWSVTYNGFTGTLPNITTVRLVIRRIGLLIQDLTTRGEILRCLYEGDFRAELIIEARRVRQITIEPGTASLTGRALEPVGGGCSAAARFRISANFTLGAAQTISLL